MTEIRSIKNAEESGGCMKRIILTVVLSMFLTFAFMPSIVSADWGFRLGEDGYNPAGPHVNFSKIDFFIPDVAQNEGVAWSGSGVTNFSNTQWSSDKINSTYVLATGPAITTGNLLFWDVLFTGTAPADFRLDYLVYNNGNGPEYGISMLIKNGVPNFTSTGWTALNVRDLPNYNRTSAAVPVPPSVFLLGAGLVGVVILRKRIHS
jgi:hypothetical protein